MGRNQFWEKYSLNNSLFLKNVLSKIEQKSDISFFGFPLIWDKIEYPLVSKIISRKMFCQSKTPRNVRSAYLQVNYFSQHEKFGTYEVFARLLQAAACKRILYSIKRSNTNQEAQRNFVLLFQS